MNLQDLKFKIIKYRLDNFSILVNGQNILDVPLAMIPSMIMEYKYDAMCRPYFQVNIAVPGWAYTKIVENSENINISMTLQQSLFNQDITEVPAFTTVYKGVYKAILAHSTPITDVDKQEIVEREDGSYNKTYTYSETYSLQILLYNKTTYDLDNNTANAVLSSSSLTDAVGYLATVGKIQNITMSPANNNTLYSEFKIPYISINANIQRICNQYNIYNTRATIFYDLDRVFILDKTPKCTAYTSSERYITHVLSLSNYSQTLAQFDGICYQDKEKATVLNIKPSAMIADDISDLDTGMPYADTILHITTNNASFDCLTPNKEFRVMIDSPKVQKYNGTYRIIKYSCALNNNGEYLTPTFSIYLGK